MLLEQFAAMIKAVVRESHHRCPRKASTVPRAGVGKTVGDDQILFAHQSRDHAEISQVSAAENKGTLGPLQLSEPPFKLDVGRMIAGHQPGAAGAGTIPLESFARGGDYARMTR